MSILGNTIESTIENAIARMVERSGAVVVSKADLPDALAQGDWLVLFAGISAKRAESADLAVILPELAKARQGALGIAVIDGEDEDDLSAEFGVLVKPTVVFMRGGEIQGLVPRLKDWAEYEQNLAALLPLEDRRAQA